MKKLAILLLTVSLLIGCGNSVTEEKTNEPKLLTDSKQETIPNLIGVDDVTFQTRFNKNLETLELPYRIKSLERTKDESITKIFMLSDNVVVTLVYPDSNYANKELEGIVVIMTPHKDLTVNMESLMVASAALSSVDENAGMKIAGKKIITTFTDVMNKQEKTQKAESKNFVINNIRYAISSTEGAGIWFTAEKYTL